MRGPTCRESMTQTPHAVSPLFADADRLQMFIAGIKDYAIYMLSPEGNIISWNAGAALFKGYAAEEILGQHFSRFYTREDQSAGLPARALRTALTEG
jgi:PAS domain S-box-containing protein